MSVTRQSLTHRHHEHGGGGTPTAAAAVEEGSSNGDGHHASPPVRRRGGKVNDYKASRRPRRISAPTALLVLAVAFPALTTLFASLPSDDGDAATGGVLAAHLLTVGRSSSSATRSAVVRPRLLAAPTPYLDGETIPSPPWGQEPPILGRKVRDLGKRADSRRITGWTSRYQFEKGNCVYIRPWQKGHRPTCNTIHEHYGELAPKSAKYEDADAELVNGGMYRDVWRVVEYDGTTDRAFKSMQMDNHEDGHELYDMMKNEAVAMDHLTKSPYVGSVHAFCALGAVYDYSTGGTFKGPAKKGLLTSLDKLKLSLHVTKSVRDVHDLYDEGVVTITVADISAGQFVRNDATGIYQLMDLNILRFMTWDDDTHVPCGFDDAPSAGFVRSPEEYSHAGPFDEKIDVWAMGNVLHSLLTGHYAFCGSDPDYSKEEVRTFVKNGDRPPSYDVIEKKGDPIELEILEVVKNTRRTEREERWSARRAAEYLDGVKRKVQNGEIRALEG